jgi:hypothetical protein
VDENTMPLEILIPVLAAIGILVWIYRRDRRRFEAERAMLFDDARGLLADSELTRKPMEYPRLRGRYKGHEAIIDALVDHMSVRKVPPLWLRVTIRADIPFAGSCDMLARAHNVEFYSPSNDFDYVLPRPADWPGHLTIKSDDPGRIPPPDLLGRHVGIFADERMKELLITPRGVRLVRQAAQASRAEYMVLRQALFGPLVLPRDYLVSLLDQAVALVEDLRQAGPSQRVAASGGVESVAGRA